MTWIHWRANSIIYMSWDVSNKENRTLDISTNPKPCDWRKLWWLAWRPSTSTNCNVNGIHVRWKGLIHHDLINIGPLFWALEMLLVVIYNLIFHSLPPRPFVTCAFSELCGFAVAKFILSMVNEGATNILIENVTVVPDFSYSGLIKLVAGMWGQFSQ